MDDFVPSTLHESKNEWCGRLVSILTPLVMDGIHSIFNESWKMCIDNNEMSKYLMTFQNLLTRVPKWNSLILEEECKRIIEKSGCNYIEDLISCVHIIQLKILTCIRVGNKQKKIDISIPKLDNFIHRVYVHSARKIYSNVYLFEKNISDLQVQKNRREMEIMVQECILNSIRESIPTEAIIRSYMDETVEEEEEVFVEPIEDIDVDVDAGVDVSLNVVTEKDLKKVEDELPPVLSVQNMNDEKVVTRLTFNDIDEQSDGTNRDAPKDVDTLEEISKSRNAQRKLEEDEDDDEELPERIKIHMDDDVTLNGVFDLDKKPEDSRNENIVLSDVEDL
jgi:hypothetical protein|tara:strand:+ start:2370 stop:3374 length:1005 start_codon:yes stop_codon:yes gene_type:complete